MFIYRWWNPKNINEYKRDRNVYGSYDMTWEDDESYDDEKAWQDALGNDDETKLKFETKKEFEQRLGRIKKYLATRTEHNIVLVGHCGYFRHLLNIWSYIGNCGIVEAHFDPHTESITHTTFVSL